MALFEVPGWSMPSDLLPMQASPRKRKRSVSEDKVHNAEVNFEMLVKKLEGRSLSAKKEKGKGELSKKPASTRKSDGRNRKKHNASQSKSSSEPYNRKKAVDTTQGPARSPVVEVRNRAPTQSKQYERGEKKHKNQMKEKKTQPGVRTHDHTEPSIRSGNEVTPDLTPLQTKMKQRLDGARFRWINEILYNSSGIDAERLMREDDNVFEEYHAGFRHQVASWPSNPVNYFIKALSTYPERTLVVDLGCGDASIARSLVPKGLSVISYDLVSKNDLVIAADVCKKIPLPGAADDEDGQIVDVVVCSLSLMNTDWLNCIREARRVLRIEGELRIAEVTSRITNVEEFTSLIKAIGFNLVSKDESNTHFKLFEFKKSKGHGISDKSWRKLMPRSKVLEPCEYKAR